MKTNNRNTSRNIKIIPFILIIVIILTSCNGQKTPTDPSNNSSGDTRQELLLRANILKKAAHWLSSDHGGSRDDGVPYSLEVGSGPDGKYRADCSGYVSYAWSLPDDDGGLNTVGLYNLGIPIPVEDLQPGDILVAEKSHALLFVGWIDKEEGSFIAYEENGVWKKRAIRRPEDLSTPELYIDWDLCDSPNTCPIIGEDDGDGSGRGPYTAFQHPEIAALNPANEQLLANKLPLEELIQLPNMTGPDLIFIELNHLDETDHDLSVIDPNSPDRLPPDVPEDIIPEGSNDGGYPGCLVLNQKSGITESKYGVIGTTNNWCYCDEDSKFRDNLPSAVLTDNNGIMTNLEGYTRHSYNCVNFIHSFPENTFDEPYTLETTINGYLASDSFVIRTNYIYIPGWSSNEMVRVMLFIYEPDLGKSLYISELAPISNDAGELWLRPHRELTNYDLFLIGDNSDPKLVSIYGEEYSIDYLRMVDRSNPNAGTIQFKRPSQLNGGDPESGSETDQATSIDLPYEYCKVGPLSRLQLGMYAYVSLDHPKTNAVRIKPGINKTFLGRLEPGDAMEIIRGPVCNNGYTWWYVEEIGSSLSGWTAEGDKVNYWLVPCGNSNCP